jgi:hypothetical protein
MNPNFLNKIRVFQSATRSDVRVFLVRDIRVRDRDIRVRDSGIGFYARSDGRIGRVMAPLLCCLVTGVRATRVSVCSRVCIGMDAHADLDNTNIPLLHKFAKILLVNLSKP